MQKLRLVILVIGLVLAGSIILTTKGVKADTDDLAICTKTGEYCLWANTFKTEINVGKFDNTSYNEAVDLKADKVCGNNTVTETCPFTDHSIDSADYGDYIETVYFWDVTQPDCLVAYGTTGYAWLNTCSAQAAEIVINQTGGGYYQMINVYDTNNGSNGESPWYLCTDTADDLYITNTDTGLYCTWYQFYYVPSDSMGPNNP